MADNLDSRLGDLYDSLDEYSPNDFAPWRLAQVFNALLMAAKASNGSDPVIEAIEPVEQSMLGPVANIDCATMRATTTLLRGVVATSK